MAIPAGDVAPIVITNVITVAVAVTVLLRGPVGKGLARAMEVGAGGPPTPDPRIDQLEHRLAELEAAQGRLAELEERVDFAERLLTRNEAATRLPSPRGSE